MSSPTSRTLNLLKKQGWTVQVVERWNAFARKRVDLFGFIDLVAIKPGSILGVQATSTGNMSARVEKAKVSPHLRTWLKAGGRFEVWGWAKRGKKGKQKRYKLRKHIITLYDLEN